MATIVTGSAHPAAVQSATAPNLPAAQAVALTDGEGNVLRMVANGDGTATLSGGVSTFLTYLSAAQAAANAGTSFSTAGVASLAVDATVTVFTGGTAPTVTFFIDRLAADNVWYRAWASAAVSAPGTASANIGPGQSGTAPAATSNITAVLTGTARFGWSYTGTPTSVTFSASVIGR